MSDDLNQKYFEARRKHNASYSKRGYVLWIVLGLGALSFFLWRAVLNNQKHNEQIAKLTKELVEQGKMTKGDTIIASKFTGSEILILKGCIYKEFEGGFVSYRNDSSGLTYITKRIISVADTSSLIRQWAKNYSRTSPSYQYSNLRKDSTGDGYRESADIAEKDKVGADLRGKLRMTKKGGLIYMLQIYSYPAAWDKLSTDIDRIERSFRIVE